MPFTNVDNLKKMKENVKKNEFPKIAGYKINLPFGAEEESLILTKYRCCCKLIYVFGYFFVGAKRRCM